MAKNKKITNLENSIKFSNIFQDCFNNNLKDENVDSIIMALEKVNEMIDDMLDNENANVYMENVPFLVEFKNNFFQKYRGKPVMQFMYAYFNDNIPRCFKLAIYFEEHMELQELNTYRQKLSKEEITRVDKLVSLIWQLKDAKTLFALYDDYQDKFANVIDIDAEDMAIPNQLTKNWVKYHVSYCQNTNGVLYIIRHVDDMDYISCFKFTQEDILPIEKDILSIIVEKVKDNINIRNYELEEYKL